MKKSEKNKRKKMGFGRRVWAVVMAAVLLSGIWAGPEGTVRAEEAVSFVDISADLISLSPQAAEMTMNVAVRNMGEETALAFSVADENVCSVEWAKEYTRLCYRRGEVLGETLVTVYVVGHPEIMRQILVTNKEAADSYVYEGNENMDIYGLSLPPVPYEVHMASVDPKGYFGLLYRNTAGDMEVLASAAGAFEGSAVIPKGESGASLQVLAAGPWKIVLMPLGSAAMPTQTGAGARVSGQFRGDDRAHSVYCVNQAGKGNFIVWLHDVNDGTKRLLANGAGAFGKTTEDVYLSASHSYYLSVESAGNWLVEFSR